MKVGIILLMSLFGTPVLVAQDTTKITCQPKKTFVIRKKEQATIPKPNTKTISSTPVPNELEIKNKKKIQTDLISSKPNDNTFIEAKKSSDIKEAVAKMPTLAGGEFGLMDIHPYQKKMNLENWKYVIFQYSVSQYGWATQVDVLESNDSLLEAVVLRNLKKSKWNPARNKTGTPINYRMYQQVVIVKDRTYEEDYNND